MIITIVRHGEAGVAATDQARELTASGVANIQTASCRLAEIFARRSLPSPDRILHSAWRRTTQTADVLAAGLSVPSQAFEPLLPGGTIAGVDGGLSQYIGVAYAHSHLVLVGHQPLVSQLVDHYLNETGSVPMLSPGGLVCIRLDQAAFGCGRKLFWAMPPDYHEST